MLEVSRLSKRFGSNRVLTNINLTLQPGEVVALFGPNGAGKTTLIRLICGLERPDSGQVLLHQDGQVLPVTDQKHTLGVILHQPLLYEALTPHENLRFYAKLYGLPDPEQRITELLERVGLKKRAQDSVRIFSRGMKQRLALARAMLHQPRILMLDEPYTGLDREGCALVNTLLKEEAAKGCLILLTSHDFDNISLTATRFDVLTGGRISLSQPAGDLTGAQLAAAYTSALQTSQARAEVRA